MWVNLLVTDSGISMVTVHTMCNNTSLAHTRQPAVETTPPALAHAHNVEATHPRPLLCTFGWRRPCGTRPPHQANRQPRHMHSQLHTAIAQAFPAAATVPSSPRQGWTFHTVKSTATRDTQVPRAGAHTNIMLPAAAPEQLDPAMSLQPNPHNHSAPALRRVPECTVPSKVLKAQHCRGLLPHCCPFLLPPNHPPMAHCRPVPAAARKFMHVGAACDQFGGCGGQAAALAARPAVPAHPSTHTAAARSGG